MSDLIERTDILLLPQPAHALGALLAVPVPDLENGEGLPLLWHYREATSSPGPPPARPEAPVADATVTSRSS